MNIDYSIPFVELSLWLVVVVIVCHQRRRLPRASPYIVAALFLLWASIDGDMNVIIEQNIVRSNLVHNALQYSKTHTHVPLHQSLLVFQHLPRTSGDSLRTHLFADFSAPNSPNMEYGPASIEDDDAPPLPWPMTRRAADAHTQHHLLHSARLIKGFLSTNDLQAIGEHRPLRVFTVLRHPIERVLSWHARFGHGVPALEFFDNRLQSPIYQSDKAPLNVEQNITAERRRTHVVSFAHNAATYFYGCQLHVDYRHQCQGDALARAKRHLSHDLEYVAFYENMVVDFFELWHRFFNDVHIPFPWPHLMWLGYVASTPRLRTLRWSEAAPTAVVEAAKRCNELDIELYEWARLHFNQRYRLYASYNEFYIACVPPLAIAIIVLLLLYCTQKHIRRRVCANERVEGEAKTAPV